MSINNEQSPDNSPFQTRKPEEYAPLDYRRKDSFRASVIRRMLDYEARGIPFDKWAEFPQRGCCVFTKHADGTERAITAGALLAIWQANCTPVVSRCPRCKANAYIISFVGGLSTGGGELICVGCDSVYWQFLGGLPRVYHIVVQRTPLNNSPFRGYRALFGGAKASDGKHLLASLGMPPYMG